MTTLGFVVLAKRPAPRTEHGWTYKTVSGVLPLEGAQNALKYAVAYAGEEEELSGVKDVEYVIGEMTLWTRGTSVPAMNLT